ncbi:hypothetical protein L208DRAFT_64574 [Tricholoma matsutake]|nr:hypothetical protein L208DRAFT_64574 [Tricholoma matsutake 945]
MDSFPAHAMATLPATIPLDYTNYHEFESDIADERYEFTDAPERCEIPSRPASRLGFNCNILVGDESHDRFVSPTQSWTDVGSTLGTSTSEDVDMEIISHLSSDDMLEPFDSSSFFPSASDVDDSALSSRLNEKDVDMESDSDGSSYDDPDEEPETVLLSKLQQTLAPIPFPAPQLVVSEWTASRPKFSCLPSPLSPQHTVARPFSFRHTPPRHLHHHHGYSRHALLHIKWFWTTREDDWIDTQDRDVKAYGGLSILGLGSSPVRGHAAPSDAPASVASQLPPLSIHPRRGDLSALRDPYCMHTDRYFVGLPLWTMSKTLWMIDVQIGMSAQEALETGNQGTDVTSPDPEEDESKSEVDSLDTSTFLHLSDDSDTTLVESDSDSDNSLCSRRSVTGCDELLGESTGVQEKDSSDLSYHMISRRPGKASSTGSHKRLRNGKTERITHLYPELRSQSPARARPPWATCWYRRWHLLMHLFRHDQDSAVRDSPLLVAHKKTPKFFIGDGDEEMTSSDNEDEDMEDVLFMINPLYRAENRSYQI